MRSQLALQLRCAQMTSQIWAPYRDSDKQTAQRANSKAQFRRRASAVPN